MIVVKKNQVFVSEASGQAVRALGRPVNGFVQIADLDHRNRADKKTARTVQVDSIRRRYRAA